MKKIKNNWKKILTIVLILVMFAGAGAFATSYLLTAQAVTYVKPDNSTMTAKAALDILYSGNPDIEYHSGDEVTFGGEQFYVLHDSLKSSETVELFAKTNIDRDTCDKQVKKAYGETGCTFSSSQYWGDNAGLNLNLEPGYGATDAIGKARQYAKAKGAISGRLLTKGEVENLTGVTGINKWNTISNTKIRDMLDGVGNTANTGSSYTSNGCFERYWLGSGDEGNARSVWDVSGEFSYADNGFLFFYSSRFGVRPVIKVNKADIWGDNVLGIGNVATEDGQTVNGKEASYSNPVVPKGFKAVDTDDAKWGSSDGYNKGLVIEDNDENQFVWVPVDGTNLKYEKHVYATPQLDDTSGNSNDTGNGNWKTYYYRKWQDWEDNGGDSSNVAKYGGFYIGRYEAGIPEDAPFYACQNGDPYNTGRNVTTYTPVCKKGQPVWNRISQVNAKTVSAKMYASNNAVKCGLIDSYAWDTVTTWMQNSGVDVTDSTTWGNYWNSRFDINGLYYQDGDDTYRKGSFSKLEYDTVETATGITERNKAKNIYDFAGNIDEWTTETGHRGGTEACAVRRGGNLDSNGSDGPACYRFGHVGESYFGINIGFRVVLYIQ